MDKVLDAGYVRLVDSMGSDLDVVNDAKVSFEKEATELGDREKGLIAYLKRNDEFSPFRHCMLKFEVRAPLMVARQWFKYTVGSRHGRDEFLAWNESSRRYVTEDPEFYVPEEWRSAPVNRKQGSGPPIHITKAAMWTEELHAHQQNGVVLYKAAIADGVAPEQARVFLAAYGMYVRWRWTASLAGVMWFLQERLASNAQDEIHDYAVVVRRLAYGAFPESIGVHECTEASPDPLVRVNSQANSVDWRSASSSQSYQVYRCLYCGDYWGCRHQYDAGTGSDDRWHRFGPVLKEAVTRHY
jgi:thymidylate synthase (FAD)